MSDVMTRETCPKPVKKSAYKTKQCPVLYYDPNKHYADIVFDGFGLRIDNVLSCDNNTLNIKYTGIIGKPNFKYKL